MAELIVGTNTWIDLDQANVILQTIHDPSVEADAQFDSADIPLLIEAAITISSLWAFKGYPTEPLQRLAWPRREVRIETGSFCGDWNDWPARGWCDWNDEIAYQIQYGHANALARWTYLGTDVVPDDIKEAQAILAALLKAGVKVLADTENNVSQVQLGSLSSTPKNAQYQIGSVKMRCDRWGVFVGREIVGS